MSFYKYPPCSSSQVSNDFTKLILKNSIVFQQSKFTKNLVIFISNFSFTEN